MKTCHKCHREWTSDKAQPGVKETCEGCGAYLHCCRNCRFFDPGAPNMCRVPNTETIVYRDHLNFCDEFMFRDTAVQQDDKAEQEEARQAFDQLFGAPPTPEARNAKDVFKDIPDEDKPRPTSFDDLFNA